MADLEENRDTGRNVEPLRRNPPDPTCPLLENSGLIYATNITMPALSPTME